MLYVYHKMAMGGIVRYAQWAALKALIVEHGEGKREKN